MPHDHGAIWAGPLEPPRAGSSPTKRSLSERGQSRTEFLLRSRKSKIGFSGHSEWPGAGVAEPLKVAESYGGLAGKQRSGEGGSCPIFPLACGCTTPNTQPWLEVVGRVTIAAMLGKIGLWAFA